MSRFGTRFLAALLLCACIETPLQASDGVWTQIAPAVSPASRILAGFVYDAVGDRFIGFGGATASPENLTYVCPASNPGDWSVLPTTGTRPARLWNTSVYDPVRNRVLCFGAADAGGTALTGVYQLTLGGTPTWSEIAAGGIPPALTGHSLVYDPVRDRLLVFGGVVGSTFQNTVRAVWLGSGADWDIIYPDGTPPEGRIFGSAVYDPSGDRLIVFGGQSATGYKNDAWALSLSGTPTWTQLAPSGTPPSARRRFAYDYDASNDRLIVQGGQPSSGSLPADTWALSLGASPAWTQLATAQNGPSARYGHTGAFDPVRGRVAMFGGHDSEDLEECVTFSLAAGAEAWLEIESATAHPRARGIPIGAIDDGRSRWVVADPVHLWRLSLGDTPRWAPLYATGTPPTAVYGRSVIYDPVQDRLLFFGGATTPTGAATNQLWQLSFASGALWTQLTPSGTPPSARKYPAATLDPTRSRMLMYGGDAGQKDLWSLSLGNPPAWLQIVPPGPPPPSASDPAERPMLIDPVSDRLLLPLTYVDSLTALPLSTPGAPWARIRTTNDVPCYPCVRYETRCAAYDSRRQHVLQFGGWGYNGAHNQAGDAVFELLLGPFPTWHQATQWGALAGRHASVITYDAGHDRLLVFGGKGYVWGYPASEPLFSDTWALNLTSETGVGDGASPPAASLAVSFAPNPLWHAGTMRLSLPALAPGSLEVVDLAGRLVARRDLSALGPGTHTLTLGEMDALPAGIYFARVTSGGEVANARVCKLR